MERLSPPHHSFGQEFYPHDALRAVRLADKAGATTHAALVDQIAKGLPQPSERTRHRIATKFAQRYLLPPGRASRSGNIQLPPFVRLVARSRHATAQIELLYYQLTRVDTIVGALARELFHPVCVRGLPPAGWSADEFRMRNGGRLFHDALLLTRSFIIEHARLRWEFTNRATIDRSLRVLEDAGLIAPERMASVRGHPRALRLSHHDVSPVTFIYALYDELLQAPAETASYTAQSLPGAAFAQTLLLGEAQVAAHFAVARRHQFVAQRGNSVQPVFANLDQVVDALLQQAL